MPGIERAEVPKMVFEVAASVTPAAVTFVVNLDDDFGAYGFGSGVMRVAVGDDDVGKLRFSAADLIGLLQSEPRVVLANGPEHDHAGAESKLSVGDGVVVAGDDKVFFEAEGFAKPIDRSRCIAIAQAGNNG